MNRKYTVKPKELCGDLKRKRPFMSQTQPIQRTVFAGPKHTFFDKLHATECQAV